MAKSRGRLRGGRGGKPPRRRRGGARVVDPGLFYALRACVRAVLALYGAKPLDEGLRVKLETWLEEADAWQAALPLREHEPERRQLCSQVASSESDRGTDRRLARHSVTVRKRSSPPSWPAAKATTSLPAVEDLKEDDDGTA